MEPFTDLLPCLFDNMRRSTPDLPVAHTVRELAKGVFKGGGSGGSNPPPPPPEIFRFFFEM